MNIFILSEDSEEAAQMQCDQHVVKMTLETAQLLCSAFAPGIAPYKPTHVNHPCSKWVREARDNYRWLFRHGLALANEYRYRFGKTHASEKVISWCIDHHRQLVFPRVRRTPFVVVMGQEYVQENALYRSEKSKFARWQQRRSPPAWM
jgi:hypothetical protein